MRGELIVDINRCCKDMDIIDVRMVTAKFIFDKDFLGFKGHFDNNPILPGVCKILASIDLVKKWKKKENLELKEIKSAKFFMPVTCNEELTFNCFDKEDSDALSINVTIAKGEEKVSDLKLILA
jgi:3-hydroxymyristoyl/3-hydroxydecanoyl-(acyl carrier protein) dehydratase